MGLKKRKLNDAINLLSDEQLQNDFKKNSRKRAEEFDIHNIVPNYENIYKNLINQ